MAEHTPQTPLDVLKAARELLSDPKRWTQGAYSRDADGNADYGTEMVDAPVCFCAAGALWQVTGQCPATSFASPEAVALAALERASGVSIATWNDDPRRTHAEVLDLFDRTIARLEAEAAHD